MPENYLTDNLLIDTANQSAEALVNVGLEGLKIADKSVRAIDNAVSLRSLGGVFTKHLPEHKVLDTSYGDIRSAGVEKVREWNKTAGFVADVVAPNVVDLAFGAGKITKGLKGIKHGIRLTPSLLKMARNNVDNLLSPKLVTAGGPALPSRLAISTAEQFTKANPLMIKGTKEVATEIAKSGEARRLAASVSNRAAGVDIAHDYYLRNLKGDDLARYTELAGSKSRAADYRTVESLTEAMIKQGFSPHHMDEAAQFAKTMAGRTDTDDLMRGLNNLDIFPGNHPRNFMGMYNDNTAAIQQSLTVQLHQLLGGDKTLREIKDFLKNTKFKDVIPGSELSPELFAKFKKGHIPREIQKLEYAQLKPTATRNWKEFFKGTKLDGQGLGALKGKVNLPKGLFSSEHNQMHKKIINKLPSTLDIENLIKSGKWQTLSTDDALRYLAKNQLHKQNVAMNVNSLRLKQIQTAMGKGNGDPNDWTDVIAYMAKNPQKSAMSGWYKRVSKGGDDIYKQLGRSQQDLIRDLDPKRAELVAKVFGMEQVPQSSGKIRALLSQIGLEKTLSIANN
jgi:hypothetical protein